MQFIHKFNNIKFDEPNDEDSLEMESISGSIEFKNVSFGYSPQCQILHDLSFRIEAGQTLALVN
jgi:ABC-type multidrug transport system fused ATPase/permease subunit